MAITSELLGKLGGVEVQQIDVPSFELTTDGEKKVLLSETLPEGEKKLILFEGKTSASSSVSTSSSYAVIGDYKPYVGGSFSISGVVSGTYEVAVVSGSYRDYSYEGTLYVIEI